MPAADDVLSRIQVILHQTRDAENVGAAARAMANMGLSRLVLAEVRDVDPVRSRVVATAAARPLLDAAEIVPDLAPILDRSAVVVATSAKRRPGLPALSPRTAADRLVTASAEGREVALVFGDERTGLPRWVLDRAHGISTIDAAPGRASLNLAQAILLHAFALREAADTGARSWAPAGPPDEPPMPPADLARLRDGARRLLLEAGYLDPARPDRICGALDRLLERAAPTEREGRLLLALVRRLRKRG